MHQVRRRGTAVATAAAALLGIAGSVSAAAAGRPVRPDQAFGALVNGHTGLSSPVVIAMACAGPVRPGQTGHPAGGQTVEVLRGPRTGQNGFTGARGTSIGAFFGAPPPSGPPPPGSTYVSLTRYGVRVPIPRTMVLPCSGSGQVTFVALPMDPSERSVGVPVRFVGQP